MRKEAKKDQQRDVRMDLAKTKVDDKTVNEVLENIRTRLDRVHVAPPSKSSSPSEFKLRSSLKISSIAACARKRVHLKKVRGCELGRQLSSESKSQGQCLTRQRTNESKLEAGDLNRRRSNEIEVELGNESKLQTHGLERQRTNDSKLHGHELSRQRTNESKLHSYQLGRSQSSEMGLQLVETTIHVCELCRQRTADSTIQGHKLRRRRSCNRNQGLRRHFKDKNMFHGNDSYRQTIQESEIQLWRVGSNGSLKYDIYPIEIEVDALDFALKPKHSDLRSIDNVEERDDVTCRTDSTQLTIVPDHLKDILTSRALLQIQESKSKNLPHTPLNLKEQAMKDLMEIVRWGDKIGETIWGTNDAPEAKATNDVPREINLTRNAKVGEYLASRIDFARKMTKHQLKLKSRRKREVKSLEDPFKFNKINRQSQGPKVAKGTSVHELFQGLLHDMDDFEELIWDKGGMDERSYQQKTEKKLNQGASVTSGKSKIGAAEGSASVMSGESKILTAEGSASVVSGESTVPHGAQSIDHQVTKSIGSSGFSVSEQSKYITSKPSWPEASKVYPSRPKTVRFEKEGISSKMWKLVRRKSTWKSRGRNRNAVDTASVTRLASLIVKNSQPVNKPVPILHKTCQCNCKCAAHSGGPFLESLNVCQEVQQNAISESPQQNASTNQEPDVNSFVHEKGPNELMSSHEGSENKCRACDKFATVIGIPDNRSTKPTSSAPTIIFPNDDTRNDQHFSCDESRNGASTARSSGTSRRSYLLPPNPVYPGDRRDERSVQSGSSRRTSRSRKSSVRAATSFDSGDWSDSVSSASSDSGKVPGLFGDAAKDVPATEVEDVWLANGIIRSLANAQKVTVGKIIEDICDHLDDLEDQFFSPRSHLDYEKQKKRLLARRRRRLQSESVSSRSSGGTMSRDDDSISTAMKSEFTGFKSETSATTNENSGSKGSNSGVLVRDFKKQNELLKR